MLTVLRMPFLAIGALLLSAGFILLAMLFFGDHPYRSGRLIETEAAIVGVRDYCVATSRRRTVRGSCEMLERRAARTPEAFEEATWTRSPLFTVAYSDASGRGHTKEASGWELGLPATTRIGDTVRIKYDRRSPRYVTSATAGGWRHTLQVTGIASGLLFAAAVCWFMGGGGRLITRQQERRRRAAVRQWQLLVAVAGVVLLAIGWLGHLIARSRKAGTRRPATPPGL